MTIMGNTGILCMAFAPFVYSDKVNIYGLQLFACPMTKILKKALEMAGNLQQFWWEAVFLLEFWLRRSVGDMIFMLTDFLAI
jgi:hypothetical protein